MFNCTAIVRTLRDTVSKRFCRLRLSELITQTKFITNLILSDLTSVW
jgi:hypothetical protein